MLLLASVRARHAHDGTRDNMTLHACGARGVLAHAFVSQSVCRANRMSVMRCRGIFTSASRADHRATSRARCKSSFSWVMAAKLFLSTQCYSGRYTHTHTHTHTHSSTLIYTARICRKSLRSDTVVASSPAVASAAAFSRFMRRYTSWSLDCPLVTFSASILA